MTINNTINNTTTNTLSLADSASIGRTTREAALAAKRAYGAITSHLEVINNHASALINQGISVDKVKLTVTAHLEAMLDAASVKKGGQINTDDEAGKAARQMIWANIRQAISKKGLLVIAGERPQAKQGSNYLAVWGVAQKGKLLATDTDTDEKGVNSQLPEQTPAPQIEQKTENELAAEIVSGLTDHGLEVLKIELGKEIAKRKLAAKQAAKQAKQAV